MQKTVNVFFYLLICLSISTSVWAGDTNPCCDIPAWPNYAQASNWASRPTSPDKPVDVFYVYPTIYAGKCPYNMDTLDTDLRSKVQGLLSSQAGVYSGSANLFAPYYRQVSFACLDPNEDMSSNRYFRLGAGDVMRAFDYYMRYLNQGRPFILAAHSQGSIVTIALIKDRLYDPKIQKQLVAAYVLGYSVTPDDLKAFPWLKPAQKADDTGVIISWNTQAPGATGSPVLLPSAICINPLNWTTGNTPADKSQNLGAVFFDDFTGKIKREVPHYTGAVIDTQTGALVTTPPDKLNIGNFPKGVLHKFDYAFWYRNLEQNVKDRIAAYFAAN